MKLDDDVREKSAGRLRRELQRIRNFIRSHKRKQKNARCWHNDIFLYDRTLPEGSESAGRMDLPKEELLKNCGRYIDRQQCSLNGCRKSPHSCPALK